MRITFTTLAIIAAPNLAVAQPAGAQAEVLFKQGLALMDQGKLDEACAALDASDKLEPAISTLLNRASCREKSGQLASAWGLFLEAERQTRAATDERTRQLHLTAIDHAAKLEPRLSHLTVNVPATSKRDGLEIRRGAELVDTGAWNHPLPVDGGTYTISASAARYDTWRTTIEIGGEGDAKSVDVAGLDLSPIPPPPKLRKLPIALDVGAAALLGTALAFELSSESSYDMSKREVDDARQTQLWHTAVDKRYAAESLAIAGVICAGAAAWIYWRRGAHETFAIAPMIDRDGGGVSIGGSY